MSDDAERLKRLGRLTRIAALQEELARVPVLRSVNLVHQLGRNIGELRDRVAGAQRDASVHAERDGPAARLFLADDLQRANAQIELIARERVQVEQQLPALQQQLRQRRMTREQMQGLRDSLRTGLNAKREKHAAAEADEMALQRIARQRRRSLRSSSESR